MTCVCGHARGWHRVKTVVRLVRKCHVWGCPCERFMPDHDDHEPSTRTMGRPGSHFHRAA